MVLSQNELSDHCKMITDFILSKPRTSQESDTYDWIDKKPHYLWDQNNSLKFKQFSEKSSSELEDIKQRLDAGLIESIGEKIQEIYLISAEKRFKKTKLKTDISCYY